MEKPSLPEKKENFEEIQRLELDPENGIDIVIKKIPGEKFLDYGAPFVKYDTYFPAKVILEKDGEAVDSFQKIVRGFKFYFRERERKKEPWYYVLDTDAERILMPLKWKSSKDIWRLAHEIGHGRYYLKHEDESKRRREIKELKENIEFQLYTIGERGTVWYQEQEGIVREERPATEKDMERLSKRLKEFNQKLVLLEAKSERGAWAEGLNLVRKMKREEGIDLIKPFRGKTPKETRENLKEFVHGLFALGSYERHLRKDIEKLGLEKEMEGIFTKHYKKELNKKAEEISKEVSKEASKDI